jgi:hypothetical protein
VPRAKTTGNGAISASGLPSLVVLRLALARRLVSMIIPAAGIMCSDKGVSPDIRVIGLCAGTVSCFGTAGMDDSDVRGVRLLITIISGREIMLLSISLLKYA